MLKHNDESVIGYLNLVDVELTTRSTCNSILGIGNVAVATDYQGLKLGHLLLNATWAFLRSERKTGMLICKPQLVQFYKKAGWFSFHGSVLNGGLVLTHEVFFSEDMNYLEKLKVNRQF
jgi:predicted N-acetyltransferase YhbS